MKKGIASATLTGFLVGFLLTILSVALQGTIEEGTLLLNLLVGEVLVGAVIGLYSLIILGLPALLTGAAFGYCAERLTRRLLQPH